MLGIAALSCRSATEPLANVSASTFNVQYTVARNADGSVGRLDATFRVVIVNQSPVDIHYSHCATILERKVVDQRWEFATGPVCALVVGDDRVLIPAGSSRDVSATMSAYGEVEGWPTEGLDGSYRLRLNIQFPAPISWRGMTNTRPEAQSIVTNEFALNVN